VGRDGVLGGGRPHGCHHGDGTQRGADVWDLRQVSECARLPPRTGDHPQGHQE